MAKPTHDLVVNNGKYKNEYGELKTRWLKIGSIFPTADGGEFFTINRTFNPAGVPNEDGRDTIAVSKFEIQPKAQAQVQAPAPAANPVPPVNNMSNISF